MTYETARDAATIAGGMTGGGATVLAGRYRVVRQLGTGGMGSVWLAEDVQLDGKPFAIKMLPPVLVANTRAYRQLKDEALVSMRLTHPNIVTLRAFEENGGNPFLVMDYVDGVTLDEHLAERGRLPEAEVLRILKPVAAALDYAHAEGVVHRDVKPANVMIRKDGHPFVLDFGIAREIQETLTRVTGRLSSGTLLYMPPEQLTGAHPKPAQDVYAFAAMAYECLSGEPPFARGQIEYQILHEPPPPLPPDAARARIAATVMAGLAKRPEDRPLTCAGVLIGRPEGPAIKLAGGPSGRTAGGQTGGATRAPGARMPIGAKLAPVGRLSAAGIAAGMPPPPASRTNMTPGPGRAASPLAAKPPRTNMMPGPGRAVVRPLAAKSPPRINLPMWFLTLGVLLLFALAVGVGLRETSATRADAWQQRTDAENARRARERQEIEQRAARAEAERLVAERRRAAEAKVAQEEQARAAAADAERQAREKADAERRQQEIAAYAREAEATRKAEAARIYADIAAKYNHQTRLDAQQRISQEAEKRRQDTAQAAHAEQERLDAARAQRAEALARAEQERARQAEAERLRAEQERARQTQPDAVKPTVYLTASINGVPKNAHVFEGIIEKQRLTPMTVTINTSPGEKIYFGVQLQENGVVYSGIADYVTTAGNRNLNIEMTPVRNCHACGRRLPDYLAAPTCPNCRTSLLRD